VAAETTVRRAIAIDPSDGEQGPGDRMRAYAVLADIREARGDAKEAAFFRNVVKAIRLSEEADRYYAVGLLKRAVAMYEESLKLFADAYCIQSRLAIQLAELGLHEQAEAHYRRAYELMPDSFGRVESHCFGCERVFAGAQAQSLAEKVFTELAAKQPRKPQVHYLLGYLRAEQGRQAEAVPHFRTAVELDPEYLNSWEHLFQASAYVRMPATERDEIALNILRLDPLRRHAGTDLHRVSDLRRLWNAVETASRRQPPLPTNLYPLPASKSALERAQSEPGAAARMRTRHYYYPNRGTHFSPAGEIGQTPYVQSAMELLNYQGSDGQ
jgi:tetratricopeptide (TPR) repeat protein